MSKFMWLGIALVIAGITSGFLEQVFYGGRVDENNVVQESFFLPLAFILMFLGVTLIVVAAGFYLMKKMRGPGN
jgi:multisubunit Na+/H+ antiporter MnhB subunit